MLLGTGGGIFNLHLRSVTIPSMRVCVWLPYWRIHHQEFTWSMHSETLSRDHMIGNVVTDSTNFLEFSCEEGRIPIVFYFSRFACFTYLYKTVGTLSCASSKHISPAVHIYLLLLWFLIYNVYCIPPIFWSCMEHIQDQKFKSGVAVGLKSRKNSIFS